MSLCLACGFCCDGTLFNRVPLAEGDDPSLRVALKVLDGQHHGVQPCPALDGLACRVYAKRPFTCRRYRCLLLEAHESNEVSLEGAKQVVQETRALRAALAEAMGTADSGASVDRARAGSTSLPEPARQALTRLERALAFHFLGQRSQRR
ncbi:MAG: YkgJ family cysteine cluster protein [Myxococcaceae bacterium]|nr:YkgJ family cysteine cluster protein [Myxococcaceae bacterium]